MAFGETSAAVGFQVKEIKRQSRAVITSPTLLPPGRNFIRLHFITPWQAGSGADLFTSGMKWSVFIRRRSASYGGTSKQGFRSLVKMWRKPSFLSEELLLAQKREVKPCVFVIFLPKFWQKNGVEFFFSAPRPYQRKFKSLLCRYY